jgi:hypothetical protein
MADARQARQSVRVARRALSDVGVGTARHSLRVARPSTEVLSMARHSLRVMRASVGVTVKIWSGSAFVDTPVKVWSGSAFVEPEALKIWNGTAFV